jgi:DNA-binding MarR family transcriptional regulator
MTTNGCQTAGMTPKLIAEQDKSKFQDLFDTRKAAVDHYTKAIGYSKRRSVLITELMAAGYSQSDIARELGVTRQAVQKMLAIHRERGLVTELNGHGK